MNNLEFKVDFLCKQAEDNRKKALSTAKLTAVAYGILVLFVFAYTFIIYAKLKQYMTPDNISAMIKSRVEEALPNLRQQILIQSKKNAPEFADRAVKTVHDAIPQIENMAREFINEQAKVLVASLKAEVFPQFMRTLKENAGEVSEHAETITDEITSKEIAKMLVKEMEKEIDCNIIGDEFYEKLDSLRKELDKIATKPISEMTVKEAAERKILVNWTYLIKNGESIQSISETFIQRFAHLWDYFTGDFLRETNAVSSREK